MHSNAFLCQTTQYEAYRRCRLLLEQVPELAARVHELSAISPAWAGIAPAWRKICEHMDQEAPDWQNKIGAAGKAGKILRDAIAAGREQGDQQ